MTPAARVQTAIEILDRIRAGDPAERALTNWARQSRFAGSKDRAAIRDHVFDALRCWRSSAVLGGGEIGRARMIGLLRDQGADLEALFDDSRHGPSALTDADRQGGVLSENDHWDLPDWLCDRFRDSLGDMAADTALAQRRRADVFLRVNTLKSDLEGARKALEPDGILAEPHDLSPTALRVTEGARRIAQSAAFKDGLVELQDAASQAVVDLLPLTPGQRVLDYCAGGGGKTLALGARLGGGPVAVHDIDARRMRDIPPRAARAGVATRPHKAGSGGYDLVLADAPCSGSGSWRRAPEGKWRITPERLTELTDIQSQIIRDCAGLVASGGVLAYATCSVLSEENQDQIARFVQANPDWQRGPSRQFLPSDGGDGFFVACLTKP
ncbi:MAG: RsmB/NOP family class I SAM-dependent RNA methyltransferase [Pelagimonas sp.]|jgi:16S rRNA (cytosine967-C5)-methyltransferase|nr:RsmB/NOP family class I SAM-dependent RNA methyltransferase [Pelagimonas sp.]